MEDYGFFHADTFAPGLRSTLYNIIYQVFMTADRHLVALVAPRSASFVPMQWGYHDIHTWSQAESPESIAGQ